MPASSSSPSWCATETYIHTYIHPCSQCFSPLQASLFPFPFCPLRSPSSLPSQWLDGWMNPRVGIVRYVMYVLQNISVLRFFCNAQDPPSFAPSLPPLPFFSPPSSSSGHSFSRVVIGKSVCVIRGRVGGGGGKVLGWLGWGCGEGRNGGLDVNFFFSARLGIATKKHTTRLQHFLSLSCVPQPYSIPIKPYQMA